ncbi:MAG: hypothetical protein AB1568_08725 [Thermodesulfobacteriota bacterium]|jgi:hypothetical protein
MQPTPPITSDVWRKTFALCSLFFALGIAITCVLLLVLFHKPAGAGYSDSFQTLSRFRDELVSISVLISLSGLLLTLGGIIFITVLYSHRIAGPAYRLAVVSKMASGGDLCQRAHFRRKDFIKPMAEEMNAMLSHYASLMEELHNLLQQETPTGDDGHAQQPPSALAARLDEIDTILSRYRV